MIINKFPSKVMFILLNILILIAVLPPSFAFSQLEVKLPKSISIVINDSLVQFEESWMDKLISLSLDPELYYKIVTFHSETNRVTTKLKIPQILTQKEMIIQVILYYSLLTDEEDREKEYVLVYPYFSKTNKIPDVSCYYYSGGIFYFTINKWETIASLQKPTPEEIFLFNQILKISFDQVQSMDSIPDDVFSRIAKENNISEEKVRSIYQKVVLWHLKN